MYRFLHFVILAVYFVTPPVALALAVWRHRKGMKGSLSSLAVTAICGGAVGASLVLIYATGTGGKATVSQLAIAGYFATALLLILRGCDFTVQAALRRALRLNQAIGRWSRVLRVLLFSVGRVALLFGLGLPYVMAAVMVYRPRVMPLDDPRVQMGFKFERVEFRSTDGKKLVG